MRINFTFALALLVVPSYGLTAVPDTVSYVQVSARIQLSNVALAPVPAFSFDSPIVLGFLTIKKKAFSYEPDAAVGLNGKPWMTNHWFRFAVERSKWKANLGVNPSLFFENETLDSGSGVIHVQRNLTFEAAAAYRFAHCTLQLTYQNINGCDRGALSGNFLDVQSEFMFAQIGKKVLLYAKPELFYFNFDGNVDGLFASGTLNVKHARLPIALYTQGALPLWANFQGASFKWNFGMSITL